MTRHLFITAGVLGLLASTSGLPVRAANNPNGWIQTPAWNVLYLSTSCASGRTCAGCTDVDGFNVSPHSDTNWVAPHMIGIEDPHEGDDWSDITPVGAGTTGPGAFRGPTTWETTASLGFGDIVGDVVDHNAIIDRITDPDGTNPDDLTNDVYGVATTYVNNTTGAPMVVEVCTASDDSIQVWINDVLVQSRSICRGTGGGCDETVLVEIPAGISKVTTIVHEGGGGFGFRLALRQGGVALADGNGKLEFLGPGTAEGLEGQTGVTQVITDTSGYDAPNGWIRLKSWNMLFPLLNPYGCGGGGAGLMADNWVAPHVIGEEDPKFGTSWNDIDFGGDAVATGFNWANVLTRPTWVTAAGLNTNFANLRALDGNAEVIDYQFLVDAVNADVVATNPNAAGTIPSDNVLGIATTYVENKTGEPMHVQLCSASDDSFQAWVNNQLVTNVSACRGTAGDCAERFPAVLQPGINKIATLVWEGGGGWGFRLAIIKPNGAKYSDLFDGTADLEILGTGQGNAAATTQVVFAVNDRSDDRVPFNCPNDDVTVTITGNGLEGAGGYTVEDQIALGNSPVDYTRILTDLDVSDISDGGEFAIRAVGEDDTYTNVSTTGRDLWQDCDNFEFDYAEVTGDFDYSTELVDYSHETGNGRWGKFGPMARFGLANSDRFHMAQMHGPTDIDGARGAIRRTNAGGDLCDDTAEIGSPLNARPKYSRVKREGQVTTVCLSNNDAVLDDPTDDANWDFCNSNDWGGALPDMLLVGYANSEHDDSGDNWQALTYRVLEGPTPTASVLVGGQDRAGSGTVQGETITDARMRWEGLSSAAINDGLSYTVAYPGSFTLSATGSVSDTDLAGTIAPTATGVIFRPQTGPIGPFENSHAMGVVNSEGSTTADASSITVAGSGGDIWDNGIDGRVAYSAISGDFDARVRIANMDIAGLPGRWGRTGIIAMYSCDRLTKYSAAVQPIRPEAQADPLQNDSPRHQARPIHLVGNPVVADQVFTTKAYATADDLYTGWLRLVRCGDQFSSYWANDNDGTPGRWFFLGADTHPSPPDELLLGVFVGSHGSINNQQPVPVTFDNWSVDTPLCPDVTIVPMEEQRATVDLDDPGALDNAVACDGAGGFAPGIVDFDGTNVLRLVQDGIGGDANNVLFPLPGFNLGDTGFQANFTAYTSKPGSSGNVDPADGGGFVAYEGIITDPCSVLGGGGGAMAFGRGRDDIPTVRPQSLAVVVDTWDNGDGGGNAAFGQTGANNGADTLYHVAVLYNGSYTQNQTNEENGVTLPAIFSQDPGFPARGLSLEVNYAPVNETMSVVKVYGWPSDDPSMRMLLIDSIGPRLDGDITAGFAAGTGGATVNFDVTDISIAPICSELTDSVAIEGTLEGEVGGDPVALTAVGTGVDGDATYSWSAEGPGEVAADGASASVSCTGAGTVTVSVALADGGCGDDASASVEVTCTTVGGAQIPGDANGDGVVDISDGIALLENLFVNSAKELACGNNPNEGGNAILLDWNNDSTVDLSDAVSTFLWLFSGGTAHHLDTAGDGSTCVRIEGCPDGPCGL